MQSIKDEYQQFINQSSEVDDIQSAINFSKHLLQKEQFQDASFYANKAISLLQKQKQAISTENYTYFAQCFYASNDIQNTLQCTLELLKLDPTNPEFLADVGLYNLLLEDINTAQHYFLKSYELSPNNHRVCDGLAHIYGLQNDTENMHFFGNKSLEIKDKEAFSADNLNNLYKHIGNQYEINSDIPLFNSDQPQKNIISFSLWGDNPEYLEGAILNATLAPIIYPNWKCRFYCDTSVSSNVIEQLKSRGAEVRILDKNTLPFFGLFWRFFVADDPKVDRYIIRDCDCVVNSQERIAVDEWIESGRHFHIMRNYASHTELMHAGMWGGVKGAIPCIVDLIVDYYDHHSKERTIDQRFLRHYIWPIAKQSNLCHDSHYDFGISKNFSRLGQLPSDLNIGIGWQAFFKKACRTL